MLDVGWLGMKEINLDTITEYLYLPISPPTKSYCWPVALKNVRHGKFIAHQGYYVARISNCCTIKRLSAFGYHAPNLRLHFIPVAFR